jgi:D-alanine-D-alanine ligase
VKRKIRVGILFGGKSSEHEVSIASANSVVDALDKDKYEPILLGIDRQGHWLATPETARQLIGRRDEAMPTGGTQTEELAQTATAEPSPDTTGSTRMEEAHASGVVSLVTSTAGSRLSLRQSPLDAVDVVFPILHGPMGEDGTVQGLLELADIPYVGAGVAASAVGMDKQLLKTIFRAHGLPVVDFVTVIRRQWERGRDELVDAIEAALTYPVFVKPANMGSSVGINKARNREQLIAGIDIAAQYDRKILVEQGINAREVECSVLGNDNPLVSVVGEVRTWQRDFYDYVAKYTEGEADLIIPADIATETAEEVRALALRAYRAIDCAGMARADFFLERDSGKVFLSELNTIPGFTKFSMYPKLWEASGVSYAELIDRLITLALERYTDKKRSGL